MTRDDRPPDACTISTLKDVITVGVLLLMWHDEPTLRSPYLQVYSVQFLCIESCLSYHSSGQDKPQRFLSESELNDLLPSNHNFTTSIGAPLKQHIEHADDADVLVNSCPTTCIVPVGIGPSDQLSTGEQVLADTRAVSRQIALLQEGVTPHRRWIHFQLKATGQPHLLHTVF